MPDILYIKTSDGVILRFAERTAFRTWVMSGRIPLADEVFWLDAAENWRPLQELLDILGIVLPAPSADAQDSKAFPGIQDDFFKKSFGPLATAGGEPREGEWGTVRRPVITGRYGAVQDVVDVGQPKRRTTAPMAAFDVASDHAGGAAPAEGAVKIDVTGEFGRPVTDEMIAEAQAGVESASSDVDDGSGGPEASALQVSLGDSGVSDAMAAEPAGAEEGSESASVVAEVVSVDPAPEGTADVSVGGEPDGPEPRVSVTDRIGGAALEIDMVPGDGYEPFAARPEDDRSTPAVGIEFSVSPAAVKPIGATRIKAPARHTEELERELEMYRSAGGGSPAIKVLLAVLLVAAAGGLGYLGYLILSEEAGPAVKAVIVEKDPGQQHEAEVASQVPDVAQAPQAAAVVDAVPVGRLDTVPEVKSDVDVAVAAADVPVQPDTRVEMPAPAAPPAVQPVPPPVVAPAVSPAPTVVQEARPAPAVEPRKPAPSPKVEPAAIVPSPQPRPKPEPVREPPAPKPEPVKEPPAPKKAPSVGIQVAPDDYMGHVKAGNAALRRDPEQALVHYEVAESLKPGSTMILAKMGDASKALNRADTAREYYQRALRTNPNYNPAIVGLARIAREKGQTEEARKYYQRYLDVNASAPAAAEARQFLGAVQ